MKTSLFEVSLGFNLVFSDTRIYGSAAEASGFPQDII
jgi:hypothetical protein